MATTKLSEVIGNVLIGAQGRQGFQGAIGAQGVQGPQGNQGAPGAQGTTGIGYTPLTSSTSQAIFAGYQTNSLNVSVTSASSAFTVGQRVRIFNTPTPANFLEGPITTYSGTSMIVMVENIGGSGTYTDWTIVATGQRGAQGTVGAQGVQGTVGAQGVQGAGGPPGAQGVQGAGGPPGAQGAGGPPGAQGAVGAQGATGAQGAGGPPGAQGPAGAQGAGGSPGAQGAGGPPGAQGAGGPPGAQGAGGPPGAQGAGGPPGAQGPTGTFSGTTSSEIRTSASVWTGYHGSTAYAGPAVAGYYLGGDTAGAYRLWTSFENINGNYTKLNIDWHTGIKIGAYYNYGGIRFYDDAIGYGATNGRGNKCFSVAEGDTGVRVYYDIRSPIYYDNDNTAYYTNPAGASVVSDMRINDGNVQIRAGNVNRNTKWRALDTSTDVGISLYNSADTWCMQLYANAGTDYGFLNGNWAAWDMRKVPSDKLYLNNQSTYFYNGDTAYLYRVYAIGDIRSAIYYDNNDTSYYLDPTSTSNLSTTITGVAYFLANRNTSDSSAPLQAYSNNGSGATMAFHRAGYYAINFGLDSDNVIRFGGWSASANRLQMDMSGNLTMAGNVTAYSDIRLKENIKVITDALNKIKQIRGVTFTRNDAEDKEQRHAGVIAQEVELVLPEVVAEDNSGVKNVAYGNMVALLIEAIKEQQIQIEEQNKRIAFLETK